MVADICSPGFQQAVFKKPGAPVEEEEGADAEPVVMLLNTLETGTQ